MFAMIADFAALTRRDRVLPHLPRELWEARLEELRHIQIYFLSCLALNCINKETVGYEGYIIATMLDVFLQEANVGSFILERIEKLENVSYEKWNQFFFKRLDADFEPRKDRNEYLGDRTYCCRWSFYQPDRSESNTLDNQIRFRGRDRFSFPGIQFPVFRGDGLLTMFYYPIFVS